VEMKRITRSGGNCICEHSRQKNNLRNAGEEQQYMYETEAGKSGC
jgi:hypothetical protein